MDAKKLSASLAVGGEVFRADIERPRRVGLLDGDIDASQPRAVHANMGDQVATRIGDSDVHGLADFLGFLFCRCNNSARIFQMNHLFSPCASSSLRTLQPDFDGPRASGPQCLY